MREKWKRPILWKSMKATTLRLLSRKSNKAETKSYLIRDRISENDFLGYAESNDKVTKHQSGCQKVGSSENHNEVNFLD